MVVLFPRMLYVVFMAPISKPKYYDGITHLSLQSFLLSEGL
jgi:hypothetical protein